MYFNKIFTHVDEKKQTTFQVLRLYPNPVSFESQIQFPNKKDEYSISIYNAVGELVRNENVYNGSFMINRNELPSGIYFMLVRNKNEIICSQKFLIVK